MDQSSESESDMSDSKGSIDLFKCPGCLREFSNITCARCAHAVKITKDMVCSNCGKQITAIFCSYCKKLTVRKPIDWKLLPKPIPAIADILILERGEEVLAVWNGNKETLIKAVGNWGTVQTGRQTELGGLCLTNRRLIWATQKGVFGKSWSIGCGIPLEDITGISSEGALVKCVSITTPKEEYRFHLKSWLDGNKQWIDHIWFSPYVQIAIQERRDELDRAKRNEKVQLTLDFSSLQDYIQKGGLTMQSTKCPECGASVKLPKDGDQLKCDHCGANIYAQDIFKKIKELIG